MDNIVISSGHSLKVRGASGLPKGLEEVVQARRVTNKVSEYLKQLGCTVHTFHDDTSTSQNQNINTIVKYHNSKSRKLDISVHFNAFKKTDEPMGVEVLYVTESALASKLSANIAKVSGLKDRGGKKRTNLGFLNGTAKPAILIEVCFCDSTEDTRIYKDKFDEICRTIAETVSGKKLSKPVVNTPIQKAENKEEIKLYQPSNTAMINSTSIILDRLSKKENGIDSSWREKLLKGELSESDAIGLIYVAIERGMIVGEGK